VSSFSGDFSERYGWLDELIEFRVERVEGRQQWRG
jgi:hypothetical protein